MIHVPGGAGRLGALVISTALLSLVASTSAGASSSVNVSCGDVTGLVAAVNAVNASGGGSINLAAGCTYSLTARNNAVDGRQRLAGASSRR